MNLSTIVILLQMAVSLLSNQNMTADSRLQAQQFANQAIALANQALQAPQETTIQPVAPTPAIPAMILPPSQGQETQLFTAALRITVPQKAVWEDLVKNEVIEAGNGESGHPPIGSLFVNYDSVPGGENIASASFSVNGTEYPMAIVPLCANGKCNVASTTIDEASAGLQPGQSYPFTKRVETGDSYATEDGTVTIP